MSTVRRTSGLQKSTRSARPGPVVFGRECAGRRLAEEIFGEFVTSNGQFDRQSRCSSLAYFVGELM